MTVTDGILNNIYNSFVRRVYKRFNASNPVETTYSYLLQSYQLEHFLTYIGYTVTITERHTTHYSIGVENKTHFISLKDALSLYEHCGNDEINCLAYEHYICPSLLHSYKPFKKVEKLKLSRHNGLIVISTPFVKFCNPIL